MPEGFFPQEVVDALGGRMRELRGHHPVVLDDPRTMWIVQSGSAAVMTSRVEKGLPVGNRDMLFTVSQGTPLFAVSDHSESANRLILQPIDDVLLFEIPFRRVRTVLRAAGLDLAHAVETWVEKLSAFAAEGVAHQTAEKLPAEGKVSLTEGEWVKVERKTVAWIQVEDGALEIFGMPALRIGKLPLFVPISGELWLRANAPTELVVRRASQIENRSDLIRGLAIFNSLLQIRLELLAEEEHRTELARLERGAALERRMVATAVDNLAGVLNRVPVIPRRDSELLTAATLVGTVLGIEIKPPLRSENMKRVKDPIEAIARASRVRHRRVLLARRWWTDDCGPLIGRRGEDEHPVALLRVRKGYDIVEPNTGERTPVDERTNLELAPEATMLYRRLPDSTRRPWHLGRFSFHGRLGDASFIVVLALATTLLGMVVPQATGLIMDKAVPDANHRLLLELGMALIAVAFGTTLFGLAQQVITIRVAIISDAQTQSAVWDRLLNLRMSFFKRFTTGDLLERVMAVSEVNREFNGQTLRSLLTSAMALLNLALLYYYSSKLAMIAVGLGVAVAVFSIIFGLFIRRHYRALMELQGHFFGLVVQLVGAVSKIRVAGAQRRAFARWADRYTEQLDLMLKAQRLEDYVVVLNQAIPVLSTILLFWFGVKLLLGPPAGGSVAAGVGLTVGTFLAFNSAMGTFLSGATSLSGTLLETLDTLAKAKRMVPLLEAEREVDESKVDPGKLRGHVAFSGVEFRYSPEGEKILSDLSFHVNPGQFVAFVGPSGSGKSTIFRLLLGFELPEAGGVYYDGNELKGLDVIAVRRQLGVVLQGGRISAASIFDNIAAGAPLSMEDVWEAIEDAGFGDDVRELPMSVHTMISEGGTNLSGGQRQRLLIARALAHYPAILLLDEATSALDNHTQAIVSASLERRKVTRLVIAHRLSTIRNADRIYVLRKGQIEQTGTFEELVGRKGLFASMMARQVA